MSLTITSVSQLLLAIKVDMEVPPEQGKPGPCQATGLALSLLQVKGSHGLEGWMAPTPSACYNYVQRSKGNHFNKLEKSMTTMNAQHLVITKEETEIIRNNSGIEKCNN